MALLEVERVEAAVAAGVVDAAARVDDHERADDRAVGEHGARGADTAPDAADDRAGPGADAALRDRAALLAALAAT